MLKQRANANLIIIINLVEIQISYEEDGEILTILENHKANLLEIIKKKVGKESNFKTIENKAFSKLQNKFSSLEKAIDQKLNTILTSIENNQSITNSWAKIAIPNIQKEQEQQQETTTIQLQKQAIEQALKPAPKSTLKPTQKQA